MCSLQPCRLRQLLQADHNQLVRDIRAQCFRKVCCLGFRCRLHSFLRPPLCCFLLLQTSASKTKTYLYKYRWFFLDTCHAIYAFIFSGELSFGIFEFFVQKFGTEFFDFVPKKGLIIKKNLRKHGVNPSQHQRLKNVVVGPSRNHSGRDQAVPVWRSRRLRPTPRDWRQWKPLWRRTSLPIAL